MLIAGIWAIISGKVPSFLFGGGKYTIESLYARLFGVLLILPLPIMFLGSIVLFVLFGEDAVEYSFLLELGTIMGIGILAMILIRVIGKPVEVYDEIDETNALIAKKSQWAMVYALLGVTGIGSIIFCLLAFFYANQAIRLINENQVGEYYRKRAETARVIAGIFVLLWSVAFIYLVSMASSIL